MKGHPRYDSERNWLTRAQCMLKKSHLNSGKIHWKSQIPLNSTYRSTVGQRDLIEKGTDVLETTSHFGQLNISELQVWKLLYLRRPQTLYCSKLSLQPVSIKNSKTLIAFTHRQRRTKKHLSAQTHTSYYTHSPSRTTQRFWEGSLESTTTRLL